MAWLLACCMMVISVSGNAVRLSTAPAQTSADITAALTPAHDAGLRLVRLRADWPALQPARGKWQFAWLDAQVDAAIAQDCEVVLELGPSPRWAVSSLSDATADEARTAPPDPAAYTAYVTAVVRRYQARVQAYQLWARPTPRNLLANPVDVYALYRRGALAIHAVNPKLRVIAAEPGDVDLSWLDTYLRGAAEQERPEVLLLAPGRFSASPAMLWQRIDALRTRVLPAGYAPALWTELPLEPTAFTPAAAALMIGCETVCFLPPVRAEVWDDPRVIGGLRLLLLLRDYTYMGWINLAPDIPAGIFIREQDTKVLALPRVETALPFDPAGAPRGEVEIIVLEGDVQRLPVAAPIMLSLPARPVLLAGLLPPTDARQPDCRPRPVAGDRVALDLEGRDPAAIHPLPDLPGGRYRIRAHGDTMVLYSESNTAPWLHFAVPDGFLFFNRERVPVEVSVLVYGGTLPERLGFNLYYDGVNGMTYTRWQWVEMGPERLFTYTFRLDDMLLANRDGYDLRLNIGGSREEIQLANITIRKLVPTDGN